ncbi:SRPBCC family protein [Streptomyces sp. NPDC048172]|uniref:SRPBCC family protein n=1 Tax=Streptomyces sp. NPDC048172 TaxID=3365505 RepID=UPI00372009E7
MDLGTFIDFDGRPAVRFTRTYDHSVERLWQAITEPGELAHWFPSPDVRMEPRVGGKIEFAGDPNIKDDLSVGTVLAYEPPHRLAYAWGDDELHFSLRSAGDRGCELTLVNVLERRDAAARNAAGWDACLAALASRLLGTEDSDSLDWEPRYKAYLAAGLPSGAPVPGSE